jgi:hypothetical protein
MASASASRRSSENYSAKPSPKVESGAFEKSGEDGIEELKDLDIDDSKKVRGDDIVKSTRDDQAGGKDVTEEKGLGKKAEPATPAVKVVEQSTKPTPQSPTTKKSTGQVGVESPKVKRPTGQFGVESPKAKKTTATVNPKAVAPQSPKASTAKATTPSKIPTPSATKQPSSTSSVRTRTTSGSSRIPQAVKPQPKSMPSETMAPDEKTKSAVSTTKPPIPKASTPAKPLATVKAASPASSTSVPRPSTTKKNPLPSSTKTPRPAPSSFSRGTASKLTPSNTGPLKRPSSTTPGSSSISPTPLRPQITGTPSKHTASSLAKAKEASERRQSLQLGRSSSQRQSLTKEVPKSTPPSIVRTTVPSSASRLMQGTASSRAKAAAAQPASPTRAKTVKPTTIPPAKGTASKRASIVPAKSTESTSTPPTKEANGNSKDSSESAKKPTAVPVAETEIEKDNTIEPVEPRTPSPRPRNLVDDDDEAEQPNIEVESQEEAGDSEAVEKEGRAGASEGNPRAAIIGRVGLAGAREAPSASGKTNTSPVHDQAAPTKTPTANANGDNAVEAKPVTTTENGGRSPIVRLHPDDIDASGHVADPEMPRSAPSSDQTTNPAKNLFGRIGHPGAKAGGTELESPNPKPNTKDVEKDDTPKEMKWNDEELKRDPAKTIVSPDAGKGAFAEKKED